VILKYKFLLFFSTRKCYKCSKVM